MDILLPIIVVSLLIAVGFLAAFFWAVGTGQYDDEVTPGIRILFDDSLTTYEDDEDTGRTE